MCVGVCTTYMHRGQRKMLSILLYYSLYYSLPYSFETELHDFQAAWPVSSRDLPGCTHCAEVTGLNSHAWVQCRYWGFELRSMDLHSSGSYSRSHLPSSSWRTLQFAYNRTGVNAYSLSCSRTVLILPLSVSGASGCLDDVILIGPNKQEV